MINEKKKRVLITGCSSGFGLLTAVAAAKEGFDVIATMRNTEKTTHLKDALAQAKVTATIDKLDVMDPRQIDDIAKKYAPIDILINNAGILITGSFIDLTEQETRTIFETNYFGPVALTRAVVPDMIQNQSGLIINVASLAGHIGHMFNSAYSASKHALMGFSKSIRMELKPFDIKVVTVEPGYHRTEIIRTNANQSENFYDQNSPMFQYNRGFLQLMFKEIIPRAGKASDVAEKIITIMTDDNPKNHYLIGKDARFATTLKWLGLLPWLENKAYKKLKQATRREIKRELAKRSARKRKAAGAAAARRPK